MRYAIAIKPNYYQPAYGQDWPTLLRNSDGVMTFETIKSAQTYIDDANSNIYTTTDGEAGRPEMFVVTDDAIYELEQLSGDQSLYDWPNDCDEWDCGDGTGKVCGSANCANCSAVLMAGDLAVLESNRA